MFIPHIGNIDDLVLKRLLKEVENGEQLIERIENQKPGLNKMWGTGGKIRRALIKKTKDIDPELEEYEQKENQKIQELKHEAFDEESEENIIDYYRKFTAAWIEINRTLTLKSFTAQVMPFVNKAVETEYKQSQGGAKSWGLTPEEREERNRLMQKEIDRLCLEQNKSYNDACSWVSRNISKIYPKISSLHKRTVKELTKNPKK